MSAASPALVAAAAGVGFGHAILPDHWLPLAVVGRVRGWRMSTVARLSGLAGAAHVLVSLLLGGLVVGIGLQFRSALESAQSLVVGGLLVGTGLAFLLAELAGHGHGHAHVHRDAHFHRDGGDAHLDGESHAHAGSGHHTHAHGFGAAHAKPAGRAREGRVAAIAVPFGAAASPDLTILPVFLAAAAVGAGTAVEALVAFGVVTVTTIVALTLLAAYGGYRVRGRWLERWGNGVTAVALLAVGALVLAGIV